MVDEAVKFVKTNINSKDLKSNIQKLSKKLLNIKSDFSDGGRKGNKGEIKTPTHPDPENDDNIKLYIAVSNGQLDVVKILLTQKTADPGFQDNDGDTPLHLAVILGNYDMVRVLLDHRACIDQANNKGETPLSIAEKNNAVTIVSMLKKYNRHFVNV